jgi:uncharacterized membrane protein SpoIIM required for sporulation
LKEIVFINKNAEIWRNYENLLSTPKNVDPDTLADTFVKLTDDLAYAQTYFPQSETERYLNALALKTHQIIYKNKKEHSNRFVQFWKFDFPQEMYLARKYIAYSFIIFAISVLIGAVSAAHDQSFVRLVLGDDYVNMTLDNIAKGKPMAVYEEHDPFFMFVYIAFNNIKVSFLMYLMGLFTPISVAWLLFQNGVMLGSFQYFFYQQNVLYESVLSIWIHGTIEISAIVVAGATGLLLGNSILFPGTYSRKISFIKGAKRSAYIIMGLFPIIIFAAMLESFITRYTNWPDWTRIAIIAGSLAFVAWYFFRYPAKLKNKALLEANEE